MTKQQTDAVNSRQELSKYVSDLKADYLANGGEWENDTLERYLDALSAWIAAMDAVYRNQRLPEIEQPTWGTKAEMLAAACIYE